MNIYGIFKLNHKNKFGFSIEENKLSFLIPVFFENYLIGLDKNSELNLLKNFIYILKKYVYSKNKNEIISSEISNLNKLNIIEALMNLIIDYEKNGEYFIKNIKDKNNRNSINWSKTIKNNNVIVKSGPITSTMITNEDPKFIYGSFISKSKEIDKNIDFYKIYNETIDFAFSLFNGKDIKMDKSKNKLYVSIINKFISNNFKDRDLKIAKQLKIIYGNLNNYGGIENKFKVKYHERFEHIFQFLVEQNISKYCIKHKYTNEKGFYFIEKEEKKINGLNLKMDHIIEYNKKIKIIDSKFYNIDNDINSIPKTNDIIKQIGYKLLLEKIYNVNINNIENIFLFPTKESTEHIGYHDIESSEDSIFFIRCIKINVYKLILSYVKGKKFDDLINTIYKIG